jgi:hypothetical protein
MPEFCTCGAQLPPDARFCHRCGKPQRDEVISEDAAPPIPPVLTEVLPAAGPPRVSFHDPVAVRVGLSMASAAALLTLLPLVGLGFAIWWIAAGFFSVLFYRRRTGRLLSVGGGLRLGWVTGVLTFAILIVLSTAALVPAVLSSGGLAQFNAQQLRNMQFSEASVQQMLKAYESPVMLVTAVIFGLLLFFGIVTFLCTAGGALGAKIVGRN